MINFVLALVGLVLVYFKATHQIDLSWFWVSSPFWFILAGPIIFMAFSAMVLFVPILSGIAAAIALPVLWLLDRVSRFGPLQRWRRKRLIAKRFRR